MFSPMLCPSRPVPSPLHGKGGLGSLPSVSPLFKEGTDAGRHNTHKRSVALTGEGFPGWIKASPPRTTREKECYTTKKDGDNKMEGAHSEKHQAAVFLSPFQNQLWFLFFRLRGSPTARTGPLISISPPSHFSTHPPPRPEGLSIASLEGQHALKRGEDHRWTNFEKNQLCRFAFGWGGDALITQPSFPRSRAPNFGRAPPRTAGDPWEESTGVPSRMNDERFGVRKFEARYRLMAETLNYFTAVLDETRQLK